MNFAKIYENLNFLQTFENTALTYLKASLKAYENAFLSYQKVHNISKFKALEDEIIDSLKILDFAEFWAILGFKNLNEFNEKFKQNFTRNLDFNDENLTKFKQDLNLKNDENLTKFGQNLKPKNSSKNLNALFKIADIGSGAGFPAIFLALILQNANFKLFEPNAKKAAFLMLIKNELNLQNLSIFKGKIEDFKGENLSKDFKADLIISRALMKIPNLITLCQGICNENSRFLFYKGSEVFSELKTLKNYEILEFKKRKFVIFKNFKKSF